MKKLVSFATLAAVLTLSPSGGAQDKPKQEEQKGPSLPMKVQIVLSEFDGEKKVASLPYTILVATDKGTVPNFVTWGNSLRVGVRLPIAGPEKDGKPQYVDIGTNLDCGVGVTPDEGRFIMRLSIERSLLSAPKKEDDKNAVASGGEGQPIIPTFRAQELFLLKEGQPTEVIAAADPLTGHLLRVSVTLNVQK